MTLTQAQVKKKEGVDGGVRSSEVDIRRVNTSSKGRGDAVTPSTRSEKCMCLVVKPGICYFYWEAAVRMQLSAELESGCELTRIGWSTLSGDEVGKASGKADRDNFFVQVCAKDLEIERVSPCVLHTQIIWSAFSMFRPWQKKASFKIRFN